MHRLISHPASVPKIVKSVDVTLTATATGVSLWYHVTTDRHFVFPQLVSSHRRDELWKSTCFELFVKNSDTGAYCEFNFSLSSEWAAYRFSAYREGMVDMYLDINPRIDRATYGSNFVIAVDLNLPAALLPMTTVALSAIVDELDGSKSYWALAHPPGRPDFHHPDGFAVKLAPYGGL